MNRRLYVCCSAVIYMYRVSRSVKLLWLPAVTSYKNPINPVTNPNPAPSHNIHKSYSEQSGVRTHDLCRVSHTGHDRFLANPFNSLFIPPFDAINSRYWRRPCIIHDKGRNSQEPLECESAKKESGNCAVPSFFTILHFFRWNYVDLN
jgi:hypothetical protein